MRLKDCDPNWFVTEEGRHGMGITFMAPGGEFVGVWFDVPLDGGPPKPVEGAEDLRWHRTGTTFEDLTLTPSIDVFESEVGPDGKTLRDENGKRIRKRTIWHGFITNGEVT